jgi:glycosyltransferase involved in cell wall biosynthesis
VNVLVVSGLWPPDVGGPASHAPAVADWLHGRGHRVEVVVTAEERPERRPYPVRYTPRSLVVGARHGHAAAVVGAAARAADIVYTTGMFTRTALACALARRPYVLKLTGDPAFERLRARGVVGGDVESFQSDAGRAARTLTAIRDVTLRRAAHVLCPSDYLRQLVLRWGVPADRVSLLPNPAPEPPRAERLLLRQRLGLTGHTLVFAGRLTVQKDLPVLLRAVAAVDDVSLLVAGDGPERAGAEALARQLGVDGRVRFLGAQPRATVMELFTAGDAAVMSSRWENFPHTVVEALAAGAPVLTTDVGGVREAVRDGESGLLVPSGDPAALAAAVRRYLGDPDLQAVLRAGALRVAGEYAADVVFGRLEQILRCAR